MYRNLSQYTNMNQIMNEWNWIMHVERYFFEFTQRLLFMTIKVENKNNRIYLFEFRIHFTRLNLHVLIQLLIDLLYLKTHSAVVDWTSFIVHESLLNSELNRFNIMLMSKVRFHKIPQNLQFLYFLWNCCFVTS